MVPMAIGNAMIKYNIIFGWRLFMNQLIFIGVREIALLSFQSWLFHINMAKKLVYDLSPRLKGN